MIRNLKSLGLALLAVVALSAVVAPIASASEEEHSEATETTVTGLQDGTLKTAHHVIDLAGTSITCEKSNLDGEMKAATVTELTMTFKYELCTFNGVANTVVDSGQCEFIVTFNGGLDIGSQGGGNCNTNPIRITGVNCEVRIGTQKLKGLTFHNINNKTEVTMEMAINGITYTAEGAGCPKAGTFNDGSYTTGNTILTGEDPKTLKMTSIWWE
jgi:hypothetical protein